MLYNIYKELKGELIMKKLSEKEKEMIMDESRRIQELIYRYPITEKHIEVLGKFILVSSFSPEMLECFLEEQTGLRIR